MKPGGIRAAAAAAGLTACMLAFPAFSRADTFVAGSTADLPGEPPLNDGVCDSDPGPGIACTLRAAVQEANGTSGRDRIELRATRYVLQVAGPDEDAAGTGDLDLTSDVEVAGAGAVLDAGGIDRVLHLGAGGTAPQVRITLASVTGGSAELGAGILVEGGTLELDRSEVAGNLATSGDVALGGGLLIAAAARHRITASTIAENLAVGAGYAAGGGLRYEPHSGSVSVVNSTISGNEAASHGGVAQGGGLWTAGRLRLDHATLAANYVSGADGAGGNAWTEAGGLELRGSIVADGVNEAGPGAENCSGQVMSAGRNLEAHRHAGISQCLAPSAAGDRRSRRSGLVELAERGGPTRTHALLHGSAALNAVPGCPHRTDQRGRPRPAEFACEIGAYERHEFVPYETCFGRRATIFGYGAGERIIGTPGDDVILGRGGADRIDGKGGRDRICGGGGADRIAAGPGRDLVSGNHGGDRITGGPGGDLLVGAIGSDRILGGSGADRAFGRGGPDRIFGQRGADRLYGGFGRDLIAGGRGRDLLHGGLGRDRCRSSVGERRLMCP